MRRSKDAPGPDSLSGTPEADLIRGHAGDDRVDGLAGDDSLYGGAGDDHLTGGPGDDRIAGGAGDDTILGDGAFGPVPPLDPPGPLPVGNLLLGGAGDDSIIAGWGSDTAQGGAGDDTILGCGSGFPSPAGFDAFLRGDGADLLAGGAGRDLIDGGGGNDTILGGPGDDTLTGGYGADLLAGGRGADVFAFRRHDPFLSSFDTGRGEGNRDVVADFRQGQDHLDLSAYRDAFGAPSPDLPPPLFLGTGAFEAGSALQIRYDITADGRTILQFAAPRGPDAGVPEQPTGEIELLGVHHLRAEDFIF